MPNSVERLRNVTKKKKKSCTYSCVPKFLWVAIFAIIIYIPQVDINVFYRFMPI